MRIVAAALAALTLLAALPASAQAPYDELPGTAWILIEWNGEAPKPPFTPRVAFTRDFQFGGRGGCNTYSGRYAISGERIAFDPSGWTKMLCRHDRMAVDQLIAADWRRVTRMTLGGDGVLTAYAEDGAAIFRFRRAPAVEKD